MVRRGAKQPFSSGKNRFAAARRAYDQNSAIQGIQRAAKLGRQDTGHLARNAEIERCNIGKARRATHPCHPHTAAAGQGEIALFQLVLIGISGVPAEGSKAAAQHARADGKGGLCCRQQLLRRLPGPAHCTACPARRRISCTQAARSGGMALSSVRSGSGKNWITE